MIISDMSQRKILVYATLSLLLILGFSVGLWMGGNRVLKDAEALSSLSSKLRRGNTIPFGITFSEPSLARVLDIESQVLRAYALQDRQGLRIALAKWQDPEIHQVALETLRESSSNRAQDEASILRNIYGTIRRRYINSETGEWILAIRRLAGEDAAN